MRVCGPPHSHVRGCRSHMIYYLQTERERERIQWRLSTQHVHDLIRDEPRPQAKSIVIERTDGRSKSQRARVCFFFVNDFRMR